LPFQILHSGALRKNSDQASNGERVDSERFIITAAGENFDYDDDGAVFTWARKSSGRLRKAVSPICFIQVYYNSDTVSNGPVRCGIKALREDTSSGNRRTYRYWYT